MKIKIPLFTLFIFLIVACSSDFDTNETMEKNNQPNTTPQEEVKVENKIWYAQDTETGFEMKRSDYLDDIEKTPEVLIPLINESIRNNSRLHLVPSVELIKVEDDTIYITIINDFIFTEQMGSTGSSQFMDVITYTLTEIEAIEYVDFEFQEGSHAVPGKYSRNGAEELRPMENF